VKTTSRGVSWTRTYTDGLGRTAKQESDESGVTKSVVETVYEFARVRRWEKKVPQPSAPGGGRVRPGKLTLQTGDMADTLEGPGG
jgi:hypothetical protein